MSRTSHERILLVGDNDRQVHGALVQALPGAHVTNVPGYFDAIAELSANPYTTVLAAAEPIERRPESAVKTLRQLAGDGRVLLFGHPTLEPLSRKMLNFGCDDYIVTPASAGELQQMFGTPPLRIAQTPTSASTDSSSVNEPSLQASPDSKIAMLQGLPLADIFLESMLQHPHDSTGAALKELNVRIGPTMRLAHDPTGAASPSAAAPEGFAAISHAVRAHGEDLGTLHFILPHDEEEAAARHFLAQLAHMIGKVATLQDRHNRLQKLAITDDLTGIYNGRYFRHFLSRIIDKAREMHFTVTLLLFDIDNFKKYNDEFGHGVGDEILRQTAALMRRCCRDHDLVARISGDEFAVVFWEKEGPRTPRDPKSSAPPTPSRLPQTPVQVFERFRRLMATQDFPGLGPGGKGKLSISGGLASFPWNATDPATLIDAADRELMFRAKKSGKNCIYLVGEEQTPSGEIT